MKERGPVRRNDRYVSRNIGRHSFVRCNRLNDVTTYVRWLIFGAVFSVGVVRGELQRVFFDWIDYWAVAPC